MILGEPGAGKTVLLLEFALALIERALDNFNYPVPIILNLATWRSTYKNFELWLEDNLVYAGGEFGTAKKYAAELIRENQILLLLDGLDEVPQEDRNSCLVELQKFKVKQENAFINQNMPQLVICSRIVDYTIISANAPVRATIQIKPLGQDVVIKTLQQLAEKDENSAGRILYRKVQSNPHLSKQLDTAFKFHLALNLAHDYDFSDLSTEKLVDEYITKTLSKLNIPQSKAKKYLHFLPLSSRPVKIPSLLS